MVVQSAWAWMNSSELTCSAAAVRRTSVLIVGCTFTGNIAKLQGGAIALQSGSLYIQIRNSSMVIGSAGMQECGIVAAVSANTFAVSKRCDVY